MALRQTFPRTLRVRSQGDYTRVFDARTRESRGPLTVYSIPNGRKHPRLGFSVSRKVGTAVRRNRIRRLLREAFRRLQHDLPKGYDLIVVVRAHEPLTLAEYQKMLMSIAVSTHGNWERRGAAAASTSPSPPK